MNIWVAAARAAREGPGGALATVAACRGSTPVGPGAKMLIGEADRLGGTVGGGCVEADVIAAGIEVQRAGAPRLLTHHLNADVAGDLGLSCGGTVEILVEPLVHRDDGVRLYEAAGRAVDEGRHALVVTGLAWDGGGPAKAFLSGAESIVVHPFRSDCSVLIEPIVPAPRLVLFGAGHVGREVAAAARAAGFRVVVVDERAEFANAERFPDATLMVHDFRTTLDHLTLTPEDFVVIATRGHRQDALILERVAPSAARYVGLLGSARKGAVVRKALKAAGVSAAALERVRVPVGLAIGAATAEEIAVSIVAQLIQERRNSERR